jgi:NAD(P)-dependent dehydrogenase (short-subunit alcohol dehydrogenase family)
LRVFPVVVAFSPKEDMTDEQWGAVVDTNLTAVFKIMPGVAPHTAIYHETL